MDLDEIIRALGGMSEDEKAAVLDQAMQATKAHVWVPNPGPQTEAYYCDADELFYGGQAGGGKLLPLDTPIPTPSGWTLMGNLKIGDQVFDEQGQIAFVTGLSKIETPVTYRLSFDDGTHITAGADHRWLTYSAKELDSLLTKTDEWRARRRANRPSMAKGNKSVKFTAAVTARNSARRGGNQPSEGNIRTTREIVDTLLTKHGRRNHAIPITKALAMPEASLPIDPYTLGAWLGDGAKSGGVFTGIDSEIWQRIESAGYQVTHAIASDKSHYICGLVSQLKASGLHYNKHIPSAYLRASKAQRLALLQGLMDTDGHAALDGGCEFDNTNRAIIDGVYELVTSLGIKCTVQEGLAKLNGRLIGKKWRVKFVTTEPVFHLQRKAARMRGIIRKTARFRYIIDAIRVDPVAMRCISVNSQSRLYLCGKQMVPTHNSDLGIGVALNEHSRSLLLRRTNKEAMGIVERMADVLGNRDGWNGQHSIWRLGDRTIEISGCQLEEDRQKFKGNPHDMIFFDEVSDFTRSQYEFIIAWNRSTVPGQRCRVIAAGNPPTRAEGLWVVQRWAAWLDPNHPKPAKAGELRWYTTAEDGREVEVNGPGPHLIAGEYITAKSRTFIPAKLADNPDLAATNYAATLAALPEELRAAYRDGRFDIGLRDGDYQCIPTTWIREAQARWTPQPPEAVPQCAIGVDVAQGGQDETVLAIRHDGWYAPIYAVPGRMTPDGRSVAGLVVARRRDSSKVIIDLGGGYGGSALEHLRDNEIPVVGYKGSEGTTGRTLDGTLGFMNTRSKTIWRFREALDPSQPGGSTIMLPEDPALVADLTAPTFVIDRSGIKVESKESVCKRLGRSTDRGDAVMMAWTTGNKGHNVQGGFESLRKRKPQVLLGHANRRRK